MEQIERDAILDKEPFFTSNIPISMWRRDKDNKAYPVIVMPRKEACYNCEAEPFETELETIEYCKKAIAAYENAIELFKLFMNGKIDHIYMFDSPKVYLKRMEEKKRLPVK